MEEGFQEWRTWKLLLWDLDGLANVRGLIGILGGCVRVWSAVDEQVYITEYGFHALLSQFKAAANRGLLAGVYKCVLSTAFPLRFQR